MSNDLHSSYRLWALGGRDLTGFWHEPWGRVLVRDDHGMDVVAFAPCPACGAVPREHEMPTGLRRIMCVHSAKRHRIAGVPMIYGDSTDTHTQDAAGCTIYRYAPSKGRESAAPGDAA